jgi:hypothetical protein
MCALEHIISAVAKRLAVPRDMVERLAARIDTEADPLDQVAALVLLVLADGNEDWAKFFEGSPDEEKRPIVMVGILLRWLHGLRNEGLIGLAYKSTIRVSAEAVVIEMHAADGISRHVFTDNGTDQPWLSRGLQTWRSVTGRTLLWVVNDLRDHLPPALERRSFAFEVAE